MKNSQNNFFKCHVICDKIILIMGENAVVTVVLYIKIMKDSFRSEYCFYLLKKSCYIYCKYRKMF